MFVKFDVVIEFRIVFATFTNIFFSSFFDQTDFFLLFQQLFRFLLHFALHDQLVLSSMIRFLCFFRLHVSIAS